MSKGTSIQLRVWLPAMKQLARGGAYAMHWSTALRKHVLPWFLNPAPAGALVFHTNDNAR